MARKPRKPIADMIAELHSWLPNYDHGPKDYPTLVWMLLASAPGGDEAEGMGYETFNISWHEIDQLARLLEVIQDKRDVEDLVAGLMADENEEEEEEETVDEAPRQAPSYGNKRDYPKIDIFIHGNYASTTTWARTKKEAIEQFIKANRGVDGSAVTAARQTNPPRRFGPRPAARKR